MHSIDDEHKTDHWFCNRPGVRAPENILYRHPNQMCLPARDVEMEMGRLAKAPKAIEGGGVQGPGLV